MEGVRFAAQELAALVRDLDRAAELTVAETRKVVSKGLLNIKQDARGRISGLAHAPAYPYSISYETAVVHGTTVYGDVGPDKERRQGALGNILEFGTLKNPPHPHMGPAGEAEEPKFADAMEELVAKGLWSR